MMDVIFKGFDEDGVLHYLCRSYYYEHVSILMDR